MANKAARGTKRTCQSGACGQRFYDLGRDPIVCPICGTVYAIARSAAEPERGEAARRPVVRKPEPVPSLAGGEAPEVEAEDALAEVAEGEEAIAAGEDETFLEQEEEDGGGDVSGIVGGGASEGEEEG